jgi:RHS repeat-associated protein
VRKVTELATGAIKEDRIYLGAVEVFSRFGVNSIVRETLHIMDDRERVALVEARTAGLEPGVPPQLIRYQFGNHLSSASLELDDVARIISYEEYTPYGSTSYQAVRSQTETPKWYRFTGKERDEESGLYYHGARYYAPWMGRWMSCDPTGPKEAVDLYTYAQNHPVSSVDPNGAEEAPPPKLSFTDRLTRGLTQGVKQGVEGLTHIPGSPLSIVGDVKTGIAMYDAFKGEKTVGGGLIMAVNVLNPAYHAGVSAVESKEAASKGNYGEIVLKKSGVAGAG